MSMTTPRDREREEKGRGVGMDGSSKAYMKTNIPGRRDTTAEK